MEDADVGSGSNGAGDSASMGAAGNEVVQKPSGQSGLDSASTATGADLAVTNAALAATYDRIDREHGLLGDYIAEELRRLPSYAPP